MLRVVCVLKSGGDYTPEYVHRLNAMVQRNLSVPHSFVCLSDLPQSEFSVTVFQLRHEFRGFWAKPEMFELSGRNLYLDLDTIIVRQLDSFAKAITNSDEPRLWMLKPFNKKEKWASGVMAWRGDLSFIAKDLKPFDISTYRWDQRYISAKADEKLIPIQPVQDFLNIASYKHHCKDGIPEGTDVVCFHGKPRPHEAPEWIQRIWKS